MAYKSIWITEPNNKNNLSFETAVQANKLISEITRSIENLPLTSGTDRISPVRVLRLLFIRVSKEDAWMILR